MTIKELRSTTLFMKNSPGHFIAVLTRIVRKKWRIEDSGGILNWSLERSYLAIKESLENES